MLKRRTGFIAFTSFSIGGNSAETAPVNLLITGQIYNLPSQSNPIALTVSGNVA